MPTQSDSDTVQQWSDHPPCQAPLRLLRQIPHKAPEIERQIRALHRDVDYEIYQTRGVGDATRFVRIYCDLHPHDKVCFVACGGDGMLNEVASGLVGSSDKYLALYAAGVNNDFVKSFPERDFCSVSKILSGNPVGVDIIQVNDSYALNTVNIGFDAALAATVAALTEAGHPRHARTIGILRAFFTARFNHIKVWADDQRMNRHWLQFCVLCNGRWTNGRYLSAPRAEVSDGLIDVVFLRPLGLPAMLRLLPKYRRGEHLEHPWTRRKFRYRQCRNLKVVSRNLTSICLDGELLSGFTFQIRLLPKEINFILPSIVTMKKRFEPIVDKCGEIIDYLMSSPDIPDDEALRFKIRLSIEEAVENVVRYAYEDGLGWIEVGTDLDEEGLILTVLLRDAGVPFNPLEKPDPDLTLSVEDRKIGGLGIFLCKQLMDHIEYKYEDGCNILIMKKKVS